MRNRYEKPAAPPRLEFLELYLRDAQPTVSERLAAPDATEARRVKAVLTLLTLARAELAKAGDPGRLLAIRWRLRRFLEIAGLRILTAEDPIEALRHFLGQKAPRRGRPAKGHDYRDLMIATDVAELYAGGMTLEDAYEEISKQRGTPGLRQVERIYLRLRSDPAVLAVLELSAAANVEDPPPEIQGREISREQWEAYSALAAAEYPNGMTFEQHLELWSFVRRACFPH